MREQTILRAERKAKAVDLLGGECVDCGTTENLQFDHINNDREDRQHNISRMLTLDWNRVVTELHKCQLLCTSCHAKKTARENGRGPSAHGTMARYINFKCRCVACRAENARYSRARRGILSIRNTP